MLTVTRLEGLTSQSILDYAEARADREQKSHGIEDYLAGATGSIWVGSGPAGAAIWAQWLR